MIFNNSVCLIFFFFISTQSVKNKWALNYERMLQLLWQFPSPILYLISGVFYWKDLLNIKWKYWLTGNLTALPSHSSVCITVINAVICLLIFCSEILPQDQEMLDFLKNQQRLTICPPLKCICLPTRCSIDRADAYMLHSILLFLMCTHPLIYSFD